MCVLFLQILNKKKYKLQNIFFHRRRLRAGKEVDSADQKKIKRGRKRKQSKSNDEDVEEGNYLNIFLNDVEKLRVF